MTLDRRLARSAAEVFSLARWRPPHPSSRRALRADRLCSYCGGPNEALDHIRPRSRGGEDNFENLTASCSACNTKKRGSSLLGFLLRRSAELRFRDRRVLIERIKEQTRAERRLFDAIGPLPADPDHRDRLLDDLLLDACEGRIG